jgi:hypothetical protein
MSGPFDDRYLSWYCCLTREAEGVERLKLIPDALSVAE